MTTISRNVPPIVAQSLLDSCWAAALESWSRVDGRIRDLQEMSLVRQWGEGPTGGITPLKKIPAIAQALGLEYGNAAFAPSALVPYVNRFLRTSHIFCAYQRDEGMHAVILYRISDRGNISYIDPDGGHDRWKPIDWFMHRGPYVLMRKC